MAAKVPFGCERLVGSLTPPKEKEYRVTKRLQEGERPAYAAAFDFIDAKYFSLFTTVGGNRVTVYSCLEKGVIAVLQSYIDGDKDEFFILSAGHAILMGCHFKLLDESEE